MYVKKMLSNQLSQMTFHVNMKHGENEYNQTHCFESNLKIVRYNSKVSSSGAEMAKLNDSFNSNGVAESVAVNSDGSENGTETAFENPVMKIIRGFPNVSDEVIRAIRYKLSL